MAAGNTYESIATQTLGSAAASVTFSSIPSTYTDLVLVVDFGNTSGGSNNEIRINSDSGSNYSETDVGGNGSTASSARASNAGYIRAGYVNTTSEKANAIVNFMNYSNSTTYKTVLLRWNSDSYTYARVALWRNTNAITTITCTSQNASFSVGSTFNLYGVKNA